VRLLVGLIYSAVCIFVFPSFAKTEVQLKVFEWQGYISTFEAEFERYAKLKGLPIDLVFHERYITSSDDIYKEVRLGNVDVVTPTHNYFKENDARLLRVLSPINPDLVPNYLDVDEALRQDDFDKDANKIFSIPLLGGSYGLAYNADLVPAPSSWWVLFDPENEGKVSVTDQQIAANFYVAQLILNSNPQHLYNADTNPAYDDVSLRILIRRLIRNSPKAWKGIASDFGEGFNLNNLDQLHYSTTYGFLVPAAKAAGKNWKIAKPSEGQTIWLDTISITKAVTVGSEKYKAAHLLMNFMISRRTQKQIYDLFQSIVVHRELAEHLGHHNFYADPRYLWQPIKPRTVNRYNRIWMQATQDVANSN
jgi:spermidine/putrescine-binding protein